MTVEILLAAGSVGFFLIGIVMLAVAIWQTARRPDTDTDRWCSEVDEDLTRRERLIVAGGGTRIEQRPQLKALNGMGEDASNVIPMWPDRARRDAHLPRLTDGAA